VPNPDEGTFQNIKAELEKERKESKRKIIARIEKEISKFKNWLETIGFTRLPDIPKIVLEPADLMNIYYIHDFKEIHIGSSLTDENDGICHEYFISVLSQRWSKYEGKDADGQLAIIYGFSDYYAASFYDDPIFGEKFAAVFGLKPGRIRNLKEPVRLIRNEEAHKMGQAWSSLCWEFREKFGQQKVDPTICQALESLPDKLSINAVSSALFNHLLKLSPNSREQIIEEFTGRGFDVPSTSK